MRARAAEVYFAYHFCAEDFSVRARSYALLLLLLIREFAEVCFAYYLEILSRSCRSVFRALLSH